MHIPFAFGCCWFANPPNLPVDEWNSVPGQGPFLEADSDVLVDRLVIGLGNVRRAVAVAMRFWPHEGRFTPTVHGVAAVWLRSGQSAVRGDEPIKAEAQEKHRPQVSPHLVPPSCSNHHPVTG